MGLAVPPSACTRTMSGALATPPTAILSSVVDSTTAYTCGMSNHSPTSQNLTTQSLVSIAERERQRLREREEGEERVIGNKTGKEKGERERERE